MRDVDRINHQISRRAFLKVSFLLGAFSPQVHWQSILRASGDLQTLFWDDFTALQPGWLGAGFKVRTGTASITPTEGDEHALDGGFEEWDQSGKLVNWTAQSAGTSSVNREATNVHGGKFAVRYDHDAADSQGRVYQYSSMPAHTFHIVRCWARASASGAKLALVGTALGLNDNPLRELTTSYQEFVTNGRSTDDNGQIFPDGIQAAGQSVYFDDLSLKALLFPSLFALRPSALTDNVISKATFKVVPGTYAGVAACIDDPTNPQHGLIAYLNHSSVRLTKYVGGIPHDLISPSAITYVEGAPLEIRKNGTAVTLVYNGEQIGDAQTVSNIGSGTHHGLFSGYAGNIFNNFVFSDKLATFKISWAGTGLTASKSGYAYMVDQHIRSNLPLYSLITHHVAVENHNTWSNLVRLNSDTLSIAPDLIVMDMLNDSGGNHTGKALEAFIRRVWAVNPRTRLIFMKVFSVTDAQDNTTIGKPVQLTNGAFKELDTLAEAYGIPVVDYWSAVKELVNKQGHDLTEYVSADNAQPSAEGYGLMATLLKPLIPGGGAKKPASYPQRIYDTNGVYEKAPTRKLGTEYDARSGDWTDNDTRVSSTEAGSTITYSAICTSFGCYRSDGGPQDVDISIDGRPYVKMAFDQNGVEVPGGRAAHTLSIRLNSGTVTIDEFWAV